MQPLSGLNATAPPPGVEGGAGIPSAASFHLHDVLASLCCHASSKVLVPFLEGRPELVATRGGGPKAPRAGGSEACRAIRAPPEAAAQPPPQAP